MKTTTKLKTITLQESENGEITKFVNHQIEQRSLLKTQEDVIV